MLWTVKTVLIPRISGQRTHSSLRYTGTKAVCQSLQWMMSGIQFMLGNRDTTAREKNPNRSPSS